MLWQSLHTLKNRLNYWYWYCVLNCFTILPILTFLDNFYIFTIPMTMIILETCDIWDTDYNSDNWEPEFMTIFVTWQLIVTLDSIHNSCDVFIVCSTFKFQIYVTPPSDFLPIDIPFLANMWREYFSLNIWTVNHQSELEFSVFDQNWANIARIANAVQCHN